MSELREPSGSSDAYRGDPSVRDYWDARYGAHDQHWSGNPNGALVAEASDLVPGRVLDVGCGEGADAVWLAGRGWEVTALDVSGVALERAAAAAASAEQSVHFVHAGLGEAGLEPRSFDLVSAMYPVLQRTPDAAAPRALLDAVAPGGLLLVVHHVGMAQRDAHDGFVPSQYYWPADIVAMLNDHWQLELHENRPRVVPDGGQGAHHADDEVVRARRLA